MLFLLFVALIALVVLFFKSYNRLQSASQSVKETASNIDVMLRKKLELTSQFMEVCKGYADHEKLVLLKVSADQATTAGELAAANGRADMAFAYFSQLANRFPELKASANYQQLSSQLEALGNQLQGKREHYNRMVSGYNQVRNLVPTVFVARALSFSEARHLDWGDSSSMDVLRSFHTDDGAKLEAFLGGLGQQVARGTRVAVNRAAEITGEHRRDATRVTPRQSGNPDRPDPPGEGPRYWYSDHGVVQGPVTLASLAALVRQGTLAPASFVLRDGTKEWVTYQSVAPESAIDLPPPPDARPPAT